MLVFHTHWFLWLMMMMVVMICFWYEMRIASVEEPSLPVLVILSGMKREPLFWYSNLVMWHSVSTKVWLNGYCVTVFFFFLGVYIHTWLDGKGRLEEMDYGCADFKSYNTHKYAGLLLDNSSTCTVDLISYRTPMGNLTVLIPRELIGTNSIPPRWAKC